MRGSGRLVPLAPLEPVDEGPEGYEEQMEAEEERVDGMAVMTMVVGDHGAGGLGCGGMQHTGSERGLFELDEEQGGGGMMIPMVKARSDPSGRRGMMSHYYGEQGMSGTGYNHHLPGALQLHQQQAHLQHGLHPGATSVKAPVPVLDRQGSGNSSTRVVSEWERALAAGLFHRMALAEVKAASGGFSSEAVIGEGRHTVVYRGVLPGRRRKSEGGGEGGNGGAGSGGGGAGRQRRRRVSKTRSEIAPALCSAYYGGIRQLAEQT